MNLDTDYLNQLAKRIDSLEKNVSEISKIERYKLWQSLIESEEYKYKLNRFGFKVYSQNDQDGIIEKLCEILNIKRGTFVEFGCGDGIENNTRYLLLKKWKGLWIDSDSEKMRFIDDKLLKTNLYTLAKKITTDNINETMVRAIEKFNVANLDLLSIDTDWNDYYLFKALEIKPKIIVIEYNANIPSNLALTVPRNDDAVWDGTSYYGASLKALNNLAAKKGYTLVGCSIAGTDAFFIRNDLMINLIEEIPINELYIPKYGIIFNSSIEHLYEPPRFNLAFNMGHINFLDNWINLDERNA